MSNQAATVSWTFRPRTRAREEEEEGCQIRP